MDQIYYSYIESPIVSLLIAGTDSSLQWVKFAIREPSGESRKAEPQEDWLENDLHFYRITEQFHAYFNGELQKFNLDLSPEGTPFQLSVWKAIQEIPYGETTSYKEIAKRIDNPRASQAVGAALGQNPLPVVIPCHRIIGTSGKLIGFGGGLELKAKLLTLEEGVVSPQTSFPFSARI